MLYFSVCDVRQAGCAAFAFCVTNLLRLKHVHEQVLKISCLDMRFVGHAKGACNCLCARDNVKSLQLIISDRGSMSGASARWLGSACSVPVAITSSGNYTLPLLYVCGMHELAGVNEECSFVWHLVLTIEN